MHQAFVSESAEAYDLIIIGGGPAGVVGATTAAAAKKKTAVIDCYHELGGVGLNTGTIPSKTLREPALALSGLRSRDLVPNGIYTIPEVSMVGETKQSLN